MSIGPVQMLILGFEDPQFKGEALAELEKLKEADIIRVIDALVVWKDAEGNVAILQDTDLTQDEAMEYGAIVGGLIGLVQALPRVLAQRLEQEEALVADLEPKGVEGKRSADEEGAEVPQILRILDERGRLGPVPQVGEISSHPLAHGRGSVRVLDPQVLGQVDGSGAEPDVAG